MALSLLPWADYVDLMKAAAEVEQQLWQPEDEQLRAELYRQFAMNLSQGYFLYFQADPDHPDWAPFENSVFLAQPNPDAVYHFSAVDGGGVYRVAGNRGNVPVAGFATGKHMIGMANPPGPGFNNYDLDMLEIDEHGEFEVIFSTERPAGWTGNWLYLHPDSRFLLLRQFSYDWAAEREVKLAIERLDVQALKPALDVAGIDHRLRELFGGYVQRLSQLCQGVIRKAREERPSHQMQLTSYSELGNGDDWPQAYYDCIYEIQPDEALIIETALPESHVYWNIQVVDALWNQVELVHRQSSLNGHQACLDTDGKFRAVVSAQDPGVANWLDTAGNLRGMLIGRWYRSSSHPTPSVTKVKLSELDHYLPADSPRVTAQQRQQALRTRRAGAQLRRRW